jgi:ribosomal protein L39E
MSRIKSNKLKMWLVSKNRSNRGIPTFVVAKTKMKVRQSKKRRHWRTEKLGTDYVKRNKFGKKGKK